MLGHGFYGLTEGRNRGSGKSRRKLPRQGDSSKVEFLGFYNRHRPHSSLGRQTPDQAYVN